MLKSPSEAMARPSNGSPTPRPQPMYNNDADASTPVPKSDIKVLSQEIDSETGTYRLLAGSRVHYLTISVDVFDDDTMSVPYLLIPSLPDIPDGTWTRMHICKGSRGHEIETTISCDPLPGIETVWHPQRIDILSLPKIKYMHRGVYETLYRGEPAVMKVANFDWDIPRIENETWAYSVIDVYAQEHPDEYPLAPRFLGHLTEHGRVVGFLMEKLEGRFASIGDLKRCKDLVIRLHSMGLIHGDVNRYNFMIHVADDDKSCILDLEHAEPFSQEAAVLELGALPSELMEETGRGAMAMVKSQ